MNEFKTNHYFISNEFGNNSLKQNNELFCFMVKINPFIFFCQKGLFTFIYLTLIVLWKKLHEYLIFTYIFGDYIRI